MREPVFPWNKTSQRMKCNRGDSRRKRASPTRPDAWATWGLPVPTSLLQCHRSSSRWIHLDLKPSIKRVPLRVVKGSATETQKYKTEAWEIEDWRGKLQRGAASVISIPSNDSTFVTMMKREYSTSRLRVCGSS
jgi:hypothetical protein